MADPNRQSGLDEAFERIEETILPSLSLMLEALLDAASSGQTALDAEVYAAELRTIGLQLEALTKQVEAISPAHLDPKGYRIPSAAA